MNSIALLPNLAGPDMIIIFIIVLIMFGAKKLPEFAKGLGQAVREFSKAKDDMNHEIHRAGTVDTPDYHAGAHPVSADPVPLPAPAQPAVPASTVSTGVPAQAAAPVTQTVLESGGTVLPASASTQAAQAAVSQPAVNPVPAAGVSPSQPHA